MNARMWTHPVVQANVATLKERGVRFVEPGFGWLACRTVGQGRMANPDEIVGEVAGLLAKAPPKST